MMDQRKKPTVSTRVLTGLLIKYDKQNSKHIILLSGMHLGEEKMLFPNDPLLLMDSCPSDGEPHIALL